MLCYPRPLQRFWTRKFQKVPEGTSLPSSFFSSLRNITDKAGGNDSAKRRLRFGQIVSGGGSLLQSQLLSVAQDFLNFHFPSKFIVLVMGVWRICTWRERLYPISQKNLSGKDGVYKPLEGFLSYVYCVTLRGCVSQVASRYRIDRVYV